jgi:hypothetical protein
MEASPSPSTPPKRADFDVSLKCFLPSDWEWFLGRGLERNPAKGGCCGRTIPRLGIDLQTDSISTTQAGATRREHIPGGVPSVNQTDPRLGTQPTRFLETRVLDRDDR